MTKIQYTCQHCAAVYPKWQGQCAACQQWNTLVEEAVMSRSGHAHMSADRAASTTLTQLSAISLKEQKRLSTGLSEFDHVLGGGLVSDSVVLIAGDPGIGKSTLLLQVLCHVAKDQVALYVSGEESLQQVALRAKRLHLEADALTLLAETRVERIISLAEKERPAVIVLDSIQTMCTEVVASAAGSVGQVRESAARLLQYAKQQGVALFLVGHVTKEGMIAGPRVLEHMVDTVLYFEGGHHHRYRMIRAVKNRFGAVNELAVLGMTDSGLKPVSNPSAIFLSRYPMAESFAAVGSVVLVSWEGSRPLLVEVQALVDSSHLANPRRVTVGLDANRLAMLLAILNRHAGIVTYDQDVFVNAVGGLRVTETGADLALMMSVLSSLKNRGIPAATALFGEVGLSGEVRPVSGGQERLREVQRQGFQRAIIPKANAPSVTADYDGLEVVTIEHIAELLGYL